MDRIRNRSSRLSGWLFASVFFLLWTFFFLGCASKGDVRTKAKKGELTFRKIAVVPFQLVVSEDPTSNTVRCPICGTMARSCTSAENAAAVVEDLFLEKLKTFKNLLVIPGDKTEGIYRRISAESFKTKPVEVLRKVGKELEVEAVAIGYVYCFRERVGYSYSVEKPASVSLEISLVRVSDGVVVWNSYFDKTQRSLMENVLHLSSFVKEGGKWVTARQLSAEGIDDMIETFPVSR